MSNPTVPFKIIHPTGKDGKEDRQLAIITLNKRLDKTPFGSAQTVFHKIMQIDGVDSVQALGTYTMQMVLANTFNYDEVYAELAPLLEQLTSSLLVVQKPNAKLSI